MGYTVLALIGSLVVDHAVSDGATDVGLASML
jgi:hypothetical protein